MFCFKRHTVPDASPTHFRLVAAAIRGNAWSLDRVPHRHAGCSTRLLGTAYRPLGCWPRCDAIGAAMKQATRCVAPIAEQGSVPHRCGAAADVVQSSRQLGLQCVAPRSAATRNPIQDASGAAMKHSTRFAAATAEQWTVPHRSGIVTYMVQAPRQCGKQQHAKGSIQQQSKSSKQQQVKSM